jgi:site-specific DNA recombinase
MSAEVLPSLNSNRFAIYARISRDRIGADLGVERRIEDCQDLAARLHGEVMSIFRHDDIRVNSGKHRPGYEALLAVARLENVNR